MPVAKVLTAGAMLCRRRLRRSVESNIEEMAVATASMRDSRREHGRFAKCMLARRATCGK
jgi:hypothetical protein